MTGTPFDADAEESIVGAMLLSAAAIEAVLGELEPEGEQAFYRASHGVVYAACRGLYRARKPCDAITVSALLEARGRLDEAGGRERVHELAALVPATGNAAHYARIVREQWAKRRIAALCAASGEHAANGAGSAESLDGLIQGALDLDAQLGRGRKVSSTMAELGQKLEDRLKNPLTEVGVPAPFGSFPALRPSRVYVLAGQTAAGKTAIACQFAAAARRSVGFMSVEMSEEQLFDRMVAGYGVPLRQVEAGRILPPYMDAYRAALRDLTPLQIEVIDDTAGNAASLERIQRARRYGLLIVDHLHQITLGGRPGDRRQALEDEVQGFVNLARREHVPVLLLAQLSRTPGQANARPTLAMLRETARIEQQAALVSFVYRHADERGEPTGEAELIIAKDRFGPTGSFPLRFHPQLIRYEEVRQ